MRKLFLLLLVVGFMFGLAGCQTGPGQLRRQLEGGINLGWTCPSHWTPELIRQKAREQGIEIE